MRRSRKVVVTTVAGFAAVALSGAPALAGSTDGQADEIREVHQVDAEMTLVPDRTTGTVRLVGDPTAVHCVLDADGNVLRTNQVAVEANPHRSKSAGGDRQDDYACVVSNEDDPKLQVYEPWDLSHEGPGHFTQFVYHMYSYDDARVIDDESTFQVEICSTGGSSAWNAYHHTFVGSRIYDKDTEFRKIGHKWGTAVINGAVSSQLGFIAGPSAANINGSVNVQEQDNYGGSLGPHERMDPLGDWYDPAWNKNRANGYYIAPENNLWDGTGEFQGNTPQALWEYPMSGGGPGDGWGTYEGGWTTRHHCSKPLPSAECTIGY